MNHREETSFHTNLNMPVLPDTELQMQENIPRRRCGCCMKVRKFIKEHKTFLNIVLCLLFVGTMALLGVQSFTLNIARKLESETHQTDHIHPLNLTSILNNFGKCPGTEVTTPKSAILSSLLDLALQNPLPSSVMTTCALKKL